jgi:CRP/FNR family cyclic AMP-dependent transcriptional regulator
MQIEAAVERGFQCRPDVAAAVATRARLHMFTARSTIIWQGETLTHAYLLIDGEAHEMMLAANGQELLLQVHGAGALLGERGLVDAAEAPASVIAVKPSASAGFAIADFIALMQQHGCIGLAVSRAMIARASAMAHKMAAMSLLSATGRICAELARRGRASPDGVLRPVPVWSELARDVNSTRETVSRTIADLKRRGIVRQDDGALVIVAPRLLDDLVV